MSEHLDLPAGFEQPGVNGVAHGPYPETHRSSRITSPYEEAIFDALRKGRINLEEAAVAYEGLFEPQPSTPPDANRRVEHLLNTR